MFFLNLYVLEKFVYFFKRDNVKLKISNSSWKEVKKWKDYGLRLS